MYDGRVYTEVYEIINMLSDKDKAKIPEKWNQLIETKRDKEYKFDARDENTIVLPDTEKILSVIYTDYLANDEERKIIKAKENSYIHKNNNREIKNEEVKLKIEMQKTVVKYEEGFWNKLFSKIKCFFRLLKK